MQNNLETFVKSNREAFDTFEPSATLWQTIDGGVQTPASATASKIDWLKPFIFGASVIAGITYFAVNTNEAQSPQKVTSTINATSTTEVAHKELVSKREEKTVIPSIFTDTNRRQKGNSKLMAIAQSNEKGETVIKLENPVVPLVKTEVMKPIIHLAPLIPHEPIEAIIPVAPVVKTEIIAPIIHLTPIEPSNKTVGRNDTYQLVNDTVFSGIKKIEINSSLADIDVKTTNGNQTFIKFSIDEEKKKKSEKNDKTDKSEISYTLKNETLIINIYQHEKKGLQINNNCNQSFQLNLVIPTDASLAINNSLGDLTIQGVEGQECTVYNSLGDITIENCSSKIDITAVTGDLSARNNKGSLKVEISLGDFTVDQFLGNIQMNTSTGDSKISNVTGNIQLESSLGDQKYEQITGDIKSNCTTGDVRILNVKGNVDINSSLGDIHFENYIGNPIINTSSGDITGTNVELIDNITIESNLGDVHFDLVNKMDDLSFDLETSLGTININKDGHKIEETNKLIINKGKILVKGSTSSGDQSFK